MSGYIASAVAVVSLMVSLWALYSNLKYREKFDPDKVGADFNAVQTAQALLAHPDILWRTFTVLRHYIGGYEPDELRKILVRAGAVRVASKNKRELWVLRSRMIEHTKVPYDFEPIFPIEPVTQSDECYFPALYGMPDDFEIEYIPSPRHPDARSLDEKKIG